MNHYRKWLLYVLVLSLLLGGALEVNYRLCPAPLRHYVDFKAQLLSQTNNRRYRALLLGDSVFRNVADRFHRHPDVLDLSSNANVSLAGNFFLLQRFFQNNNHAENVFLFFDPDLLTSNLRSNMSYSYFTTVFNRPEEVRMIESLHRHDLFTHNDWGYKRLAAFKRLFQPCYLPAVPVFLDSQPTHLETALTNRVALIIQNRIHRSYSDFSPIAATYLRKMAELCRVHHCSLTLVLEPLPESFYPYFLRSPLMTRLDNFVCDHNLSLMDANTFLIFKDAAFIDGFHLKKNWRYRFARLINRNIVNIFPTEPCPSPQQLTQYVPVSKP